MKTNPKSAAPDHRPPGHCPPSSNSPAHAASSPDDQPAGFGLILVPVDFTAPSLRAFRYAARLAEQAGGRLHLLHVLERPVFPNNLDSRLETAELVSSFAGETVDRLKRLVQRELPAAIPAKPAASCGWPAHEIVRVAAEIRSDLIILGTYRHPGVRHEMLGCTAEAVLRRAPCPVLLVRCKERGSPEPGLWCDSANDGKAGRTSPPSVAASF